MGVSNETAVCLKCHRTARVTFLYREVVCSNCGKPMIAIGKRWRAPKRDDDKGWKILRRLVEKALACGLPASYYLTHGWQYNLTR